MATTKTPAKATAKKVETTAKTEVKTTVKKADVKPAAKAVDKKTEAKATVKKAEAKPVVKTTVKKEETKTSVNTAAKKTETAAKKTVAKKTSKENNIFVQFHGMEFDTAAIEAAVKADYTAKNGKKTTTSVSIYIKPEDMKAYYVIDGIIGDIAL